MDDEDLDNVLAGFSRASNSSSSASPLEVSDVVASANQSREHAVEVSANLQPVATRDNTTLEPGSTNTSVTLRASRRGPVEHCHGSRHCGLASDTRRALPVKIQLYLPKIQPYLPMHHFLYISSAIRPMQIRLPPMHMLTMLNTGHMHVYSVHSTGEMLRCDRPLRLQIFTRGFRLGIRHRKLHSTTESGLRSACPPERQRASGGGERRDGVVRHAVRSERASGEGVLVRRRGIGVVCTCSGKPGPGVLAANAGMCTGEKNRSWVRSDHHVPSKIHGARAPQYLGRAGARRASLRAAREEGGTPFEHWPRVRIGAPSRTS